MLPPDKWADPQEMAQLQSDMQTWCEEFGEVSACVIPPSRTSTWTQQIFIAFNEPQHALTARKHFADMKLDHGLVRAEVVSIPANLLYFM